MERSIVKEVMQRLQSIITTDNPAIHSILELSLHSQGIISRPYLLFLCADISATPKEQAVNQAVAVELLYLASSVHCESTEIKAYGSGQTAHRKLWGEKIAVLAGDYFFAKMFHVLRSYPSVLAHYAEAIQSLITSAESRILPKGKEAYLLSTCCKIGFAGGKLVDSVPGLTQYGTNFGMAYELYEVMNDRSFLNSAIIKTKNLALDYIDTSINSLSSLPSSPAKIQLISLTLTLKKLIDKLGEARLHAPAID